MAAPFRTDWRLISLLPAASFGLALLLGFLAWYFLMLQAAPYFGNPQLAGSAGVRSALGAVIAGKHMIVATTMLFVAAGGAMVVVAVWTIWEIAGEVRGDDLTDMSRVDAFLSIGLVVILVSIPAMIVILGAAQCGTPYLFQCMGKGILPELMDNYASRLFDAGPEAVRNLGLGGDHFDPHHRRRRPHPPGRDGDAAAWLLEDPVTDTDGKPMPVPVAQLKDWFTSRLKRFELISVVISLALVAGIAQMNAWMRWPQAIMNEDVLVGGSTVATSRANYEAMTDSVLQFSAAWYGLMVAALIFATRSVPRPQMPRPGGGNRGVSRHVGARTARPRRS